MNKIRSLWLKNQHNTLEIKRVETDEDAALLWEEDMHNTVTNNLTFVLKHSEFNELEAIYTTDLGKSTYFSEENSENIPVPIVSFAVRFVPSYASPPLTIDASDKLSEDIFPSAICSRRYLISDPLIAPVNLTSLSIDVNREERVPGCCTSTTVSAHKEGTPVVTKENAIAKVFIICSFVSMIYFLVALNYFLDLQSRFFL